MYRIKVVGLSLLLVSLVSANVLAPIPASSASGHVKELLKDNTKELYIDKIVLSEIPETGEQKIYVNLVCKNLLLEPRSCGDIFFFSLIDKSDIQYQPDLVESRIMAARIPERDVVQGRLVFVLPRGENATNLIYTEPKGSNFIVDLSSIKDPADKPPISEWRLISNRGLTLSDSRIELKIYTETRTEDRYVLDISIRNKGYEEVGYNAMYAYLKSSSGNVFSADLYADQEPKINSGTLQSGQQVRGKLAFDIGNELEPFMFIYDDIAGSHFATGKFLPFTLQTEIRGEIIGLNDDLVKINKHKALQDPNTRAYKIIGEISNDSERFISDIQVSATIKDQYGKILSELNHTLRNFLSSEPVKLAPKTKMPFFLDFSLHSSNVANIGSYELLLRYSFSEPKRPALLVSSTELIQVSNITPLSKQVSWLVRGVLMNIGEERSTHTHVVVSVYDSGDSIIGLGGFSPSDDQPRGLNPEQEKPFSIEINLPKALEPSSFYLYVESDQFVLVRSEAYGKAENGLEDELEVESFPVQSQNYTLIMITSKQRGHLLQLSLKNLPESTNSAYAIQISINEVSMQALKAKLRWEVKEISENELLFYTPTNSIKPGQKGKFLLSVDNEVDLAFWKVLDRNGKVLREGELNPLQIWR